MADAMEKRMRKFLYPFIILSFLAGLAMPQSVFATTQSRAIQGEGAQTDGTYQGIGSAGNYTDINSNDGNGSYLSFYFVGSNTTLYHCFNMVDFSEAGVVINGVTMTVVAQSLSAVYPTSIRPYVRIGTTNYYGTSHSMPVGYSTYTEDTFGGVQNAYPLTGEDWTNTTLNSVQFGARLSNSIGSQYAYLTYLKITVDYSLPTAPEVTTGTVTLVTSDSATLNGSITDDGGATITDYGFVWGASSNTTMPSPTQAPSATTYASNWAIGAGSYSEGAIDHATGATLVLGTRYYFRAAAYNSVGWSYGSELYFDTIDNPSVLTQAAINVAATTGRIRAYVPDDGGDDCEVMWVWVAEGGGAPYADFAAVVAEAGSANVTATGTYNTGDYPYYDLSGLAVSTTYWFCAAITNDASTQYGTPLYFTTSSGVNAPSSFKAIPSGTSISLLWVKSAGADYTYINYKVGSYPTGTGDGTNIYNGVESTYQLTGLTSGTTYYFMAWGLSGATYSADNITVMSTTLPYVTTGGELPTLGSPSNWFTVSAPTVFSKLPIYGTVNWAFDTYEVPQATGWFIIAFVLSLMGGIGVYTFSHKVLIALIAETGFLWIFSSMGMIPMFLVFLCAVFAISALVFGWRT
jgi:hypothetical protein